MLDLQFYSVTFTVAPGFVQLNGNLRPVLDNNVVLFYYYADKHLNWLLTYESNVIFLFQRQMCNPSHP